MSDNSDDILIEVRDALKEAANFETDNRENALDDLAFLDGDQWPTATKREREDEGRPCLTFNRLPTYVDQVVGDHRQARIAIHAVPVGRAAEDQQKIPAVGGDARFTLAEVYDGILTSIQSTPEALFARTHAFEQMVNAGFGAFRVNTRYVGDSFDAELVLEQIFNPFTVYLPPAAVLRGPQHADWGIVTEIVTAAAFKSQFGDDAVASDIEVDALGDDRGRWYTETGVRIAEFFKRDRVQDELLALSDGRIVFASDVQPVLDELAAAGIQVVNHRRTVRHKMRWYKVSGAKVLQGPVDWPGRYVPLIPSFGKVINREGKPSLRGLIRNAKDAQRMYNYHRSAEVEAVALAPKAPYVADVQAIAKYKNLWESANTTNLSVLPYDSHEGSVPAPQRQPPALPSSGFGQQVASAAEDMKATTGLHDASLGARSNETSGKAIQLRQQEGDVGSFAFHDNFARAMEYAGLVLVDLIPHVYTGERVVRLGLEGDREAWVKVNQQVRDEQSGAMITVADLGAARFGVRVTTGPAYTTQRAQAVDAMIELFRSVPKLGEIASDILARNMDWPGADELAERITRTLPPQLTAPGGDDGPPQPPAPSPAEQMQAQVAELELQARGAEAEAKIAEANATLAQFQPPQAPGAPLDPAALDQHIRQVVAEALQQVMGAGA